MALSIKDQEIIGEIDNLQDKLDGKLPIDRLELLYLVNSWGRTNFFYTEYLNEDVKIEKHREKECYDLSKLDVSQITNMDSVFCFSNFNGNINNWDVSNVTNMLDMFFFATNFNQDISKWDVSNVTNMSFMFYRAKQFNQPLNNWNVSKVIDMKCMFSFSKKFNQDLSSWNTSNVTSMSYMFNETDCFNQNLNFWDISSVINMGSMFSHAKSFNQIISNWDLSNIRYCDHMFDNAESFINKYNNDKQLSYHTDDIKKWFNLNRERMNDIDLKDKYGEEVDDFFSKFTNINIEINSIQRKEI